jgi:hypothetical protein
MVSVWRIGLAVLAVVDGTFHFLLGDRGPLSATNSYFLLSGVLLILGAIFVLVSSSGAVFAIGAYGLIAIAVIDDALLYLTRTYGLRFLGSIMGRGGGFRPGGNFTRTGNFTPPANFTGGGGNFTRPGGFGGGFGAHGVPWSTSWIPPGAVQTFVLQVLIIMVAIGAIVAAMRFRKNKAVPPASPATPASPTGPS